MTLLEKTAMREGKTPAQVCAEIQEMIDVGWKDRKIRAIWRRELRLRVKPSPEEFLEIVSLYVYLNVE